jgi:hypothetical protein
MRESRGVPLPTCHSPPASAPSPPIGRDCGEKLAVEGAFNFALSSALKVTRYSASQVERPFLEGELHSFMQTHGYEVSLQQ